LEVDGAAVGGRVDDPLEVDGPRGYGYSALVPSSRTVTP
jgi:hypothetical protein